MELDHTGYFRLLTNEEKKALIRYKSNEPFLGELAFAYDLNDKLLSGNALTKEWEREVELLDSAIRKYTLKQEEILYRASAQCLVGHGIQEGRLRYKAYMSTTSLICSLEKHFRDNNEMAVLIIKCPAGSNMALMEGSPTASGMEHEVLLSRDSCFQILSVEEITDKIEMANYMGRYYAECYEYRMLTKYEMLLELI